MANALKEYMADVITLKMLGILGVLSYAAARIATNANVIRYRRYAIIAVPADQMPNMPRGFDVRPLSHEDLTEHRIDVSAAVQNYRFDQGLTCLGAFNAKGKLAGVNWVSGTNFTETEVHVRFDVPENMGWDTGLWIDPKYRMSRAFAALWAGTAKWLRAQNRQYSLSWIADYNLQSIRAHERMGAVTIGHLVSISFLGWQFVANGYPKFVKVSRDRPSKLILRELDNFAALMT
jgi:hypothetical protein